MKMDSATAARFAAAHASPAVFARDFLRLDPTGQQEEFFASVAKPGSRTAVRSGHGTGKSTSLATIALWLAFTRRNALVPCTAPTAHQLQDVLWREIRRLINCMSEKCQAFFQINSDRIVVPANDSMIVARTARPENPDALQGFHAPEILFIIDEAPGVANTIFEVARGALSSPGARVAMTGNPTRLSGYFYDAFHGSREMWSRICFSCLDSRLVSEDYPRDMAAEFGVDSDVYRMRVLGEFPRTGVYNLIPLELVEAAMERQMPPGWQAHAPKVLGLDVAWMGTDRSVCMLRQGLSARSVFSIRGADTIRLSELTARAAEKIQPDAIFVDCTGVGAGVLDQLVKIGLPVIGIHFASKPLKPEQFLNRRAEIWWLMKEWLEMGPVLQRNTDLRDDLVAPEYTTQSSNGKIQLESKDSMRKRGIASPDYGDALALTFAMPVHAKRKNSAVRPAGTQAYNPHAWMERR